MQMSVSPEKELMNGLLCLEGGLKSIPSSSSVYDFLVFPWLLFSPWLTADRWEEGTEEEGSYFVLITNVWNQPLTCHMFLAETTAHLQGLVSVQDTWHKGVCPSGRPGSSPI